MVIDDCANVNVLAFILQETFNKRQSRPSGYFVDWNRWLPIMKNYEARKPSYFATPAVNLVRGLHVGLKELLANGMEQRFAVHRQSAANFR